MAVVACYLSPNYSRARGEEALAFITDTIIEIKRKYSNPYIVVAGDFNQWRVDNALSDLPEVAVGNTRKDKRIDHISTNTGRNVTESGTVAPLETEDLDARESDHRVAYSRTCLPRARTFEWQTYSYRHYNVQSLEELKSWILMHEWGEVIGAPTSNDEANV